MRLGLATCRDLPDWEVDDRPLHERLLARGVELEHPVWDDGTVDWTDYDAVLIRTTWDYMERREHFVVEHPHVSQCDARRNNDAQYRYDGCYKQGPMRDDKILKQFSHENIQTLPVYP